MDVSIRQQTSCGLSVLRPILMIISKWANLKFLVDQKLWRSLGTREPVAAGIMTFRSSATDTQTQLSWNDRSLGTRRPKRVLHKFTGFWFKAVSCLRVTCFVHPSSDLSILDILRQHIYITQLNCQKILSQGFLSWGLANLKNYKSPQGQ